MLKIFFTKNETYTFENKRFDTKHTHGTGCTFSAVITAELAKGRSIKDAVKKAKEFISLSIEHTPEIGKERTCKSFCLYEESRFR